MSPYGIVFPWRAIRAFGCRCCCLFLIAADRPKGPDGAADLP
jgi:hypothetical protein